jgi:membrane fusion protein, multidrug efflux system
MPVRLARLTSILAACAALAACAKQDNLSPAAGRRGAGPQKQAVEVTAVERRDLVETLDVVGSLAANESAEMRPEIAGLVREILFEEGQTVKKGHVLLRIDDAELRAQFAQVEARHRLAQLNVQRSESLSESRTIAQSETDRARSEFAGAQAELALLRTRLEKTEIKAPFDGIIGSRTISPGDYVTTATVVTTLNDLSRLKVDFQVPERFLNKVEIGTTFLVRSRAMPAGSEIRGEVYFVSSIIDRNTRSSEVKGFLDKPPPVLKPGMFANIELVLQVRKGALTVPEGSILISPSGSQIVAVREQGADKVADFVPVQLGMRAKGLVEVTPLKGELAENQVVVASGVGALILFQGAKLDPRPLRAEFRVGN